MVRIFNTYGPRMHPHDGRVVSNFIIQALLGREITIYGDGEQTRSFCYVDDLIDGLVRLMQSGDEVIGPINIGNPVEFSIIALAKEVIDSPARSCASHTSRCHRTTLSSQPDITKAWSLLGWKPGTLLRNGLKKTIAYFQVLLRELGTMDLINNGRDARGGV